MLGLEQPPDPGRPLSELGLDSLMAVNLVNRLESRLGVSVPTASILEGPSVGQIAERVYPQLDLTEADEDAEEKDASVTSPVASLPSAPAKPPRAGERWLVFLAPKPEATCRLFCFPFAGAGSAVFREWGEALGPSIEVVAIEPPGRLSRIREQPVDDIHVFVRELLPALLGSVDKPFAFFGHCLGGLTMFEVCRTLVDETPYKPVHLFVSGARPPHRLVMEARFEQILMEDLLRRQEFELGMPLHAQPDLVFAQAIRHFNIPATERLLEQSDLRRLLMPTIRAEFEMASKYRYAPCPPFEVPITCFTGLEDRYAGPTEMLGWMRFTSSSFKVYQRTGEHFLLVDDKDFLQEIVRQELVGASRTSVAS